jgi:hypothetical protein
LIWIKALAAEKCQHPTSHNGARESAKMHDLIGSGGMLRGWVAIWSTQMLWFLATMIVMITIMAMTELLIAGYARRARVIVPVQPSVIEGDRPGAAVE